MGTIIIEANAEALATRVAQDLVQAARLAAAAGRRFCLALSGGSTPKLLYEQLGSPTFANQMPWSNVELFWGDERCVAPDAPDSNYRMVSQAMLNYVPVAPSQIHRVLGDNAPALESGRYAHEIRSVVPTPQGGLPRFDWVLLGMGDDGHTASLFPGQTLSSENELCGVAAHPTNGTQRVSFTYGLINAAAHVAFLVTGANKAGLVHTIINRQPGCEALPAAHIRPSVGSISWYLDTAAGSALPEQGGNAGMSGQ